MEKRFERVLIVGDTLRPWQNGDRYTSGAFRNIQWIYHLLKWIFDEEHIPVSALDWNGYDCSIQYTKFDIAAYYASRELDIDLDSWVKLANSKKSCELLWSQLAKLTQGTLVVGYEMSNIFIETLKNNNVKYIDVALHPIRYMDDILHSIRTNDFVIHQQLIKSRFSSNEYWKKAALVKAKICRYPTTINTPPNTTIILGQVWTDRALSKVDGGFYDLEGYLTDVKRIVNESSAVLYKPHPFEKFSFKSSDIHKIFKSIKTTDVNYYHLLAQPTVTKVCGLNSSGLYEAKYFGRRTEYFIPQQYDLKDDSKINEIEVGDFVTVGNIWTEHGFWMPILYEGAHSDGCYATYIKDNELRRSMNTDWGYGYINQLVIKS